MPDKLVPPKTIRDFREQHPEYQSYSDENIAKEFYENYAFDVPYEVFAKSFISYKARSPEEEIQDARNVLRYAIPSKSFAVATPSAGPFEPSGFEPYMEFDPKQYEQFWKTGSSWSRNIGGTIGGIAGAFVARPVMSAIAGGATGEAIVQTAKRTTFRPPSEYLKEHPQVFPSKEAIIGAGLEQGAYEIGGRLVAKGAGKVMSPLKRKTLPAAVRVSKELSKYGAHLTPAQMSEARVIDTLETIATGSLFGGGKIQQYKTLTQPAAIQKWSGELLDDVIGKAGKRLTNTEMGQLVLSELTGRKEASRIIGGVLYKNADDMAKAAGLTVNFTDARYALLELAERQADLPLKEALISKVLTIKDVADLTTARAIRSEILDVARAKGGMAKKIAGIIDNAIEESLKSQPEIVGAWRGANAMWARTFGKQGFDSKILKSLLQNKGARGLAENPEMVIKTIFRPDKTTAMKIVKGNVDAKTWQTLKFGYLQDVIQNATSTQAIMPTGKPLELISGDIMATRFQQMGNEGLKTIFTSRELKNIKTTITAAQYAQSSAGGGGAMLIQLTQAGALLNMGRAPGKGAGFLLSPPALARLIMSDFGSRWLSEGFKTPRYTAQAAVITMRLLNLMANTETEPIISDPSDIGLYKE